MRAFAARYHSDDLHQLSGFPHRQFPKNHRFDQSKDGCVCSDAEPRRQESDSREAGTLREQPHGIPHIGRELLEPARTTFVPAIFLELCDTAELPQGFSARLSGSQTAFDSLPRQLFQMEPHLIVHLGLHTPPPEQRTEPQLKPVNRAHGLHAVSTMSSTAPESRLQFASSCSS